MPESALATRPPADTPKYRRLADIDRAFILKLSDAGRTQVEIAEQLRIAQSTVSQVLTAFTDTTADSKRYLRGQALPMARNIVKKGRAADHVAALKGLGVLEDQPSSGLTIVVGGMGNDVRIGILTGEARAALVDPD